MGNGYGPQAQIAGGVTNGFGDDRLKDPETQLDGG